MRPLPPLDSRRHGVFTLSEALAAGWTIGAVKHAVRVGGLVRLDRGVYAPAIDGDDAESVRARFLQASVAAVLVCRPAAASHLSSAGLADLPLWTTPERGCVTVHPKYTGDAHTAHLHRASVLPHELLPTVVRRLRTARTIADIARECGVEDAVVVGDAALHRGLTDVDSVLAAGSRCEGWPGFRRAAAAIPLLDGRSESPLESVSRIRLVAHGIPAPELQPWILDRHGVVIGRVDLYWDEAGVVGEVDGKVKLRDNPDEAAWKWLKRQGLLSRTGLEVVRWGRSDLEDMPRLTQRLWDAFADGRRKIAAERNWIVQYTDPFVPRRAAI